MYAFYLYKIMTKTNVIGFLLDMGFLLDPIKVLAQCLTKGNSKSPMQQALQETDWKRHFQMEQISAELYTKTQYPIQCFRVLP